MKTGVKKTIRSIVEEHMTTVVRNAITMQRHSKRPRRTLHSSSVKLALAALQNDGNATSNTPLVTVQTNKVDLNALLSSEIPVQPPSELGMTLHWLAVEGHQTTSMYNPSEDQESRKRKTHDSAEAHDSAVALRQLLPRLVSDELQLYFTRIIHTLNTDPDAAIKRLSSDSGIQELIPFFTRYITTTFHQNMNNTEQCRLMIQCVDSLIRNGNIHLELHLDQLLPRILTCVVAKKIGGENDNHWFLRDEASDVLVRTCTLFGDKYGNLRGKVIQALCRALDLSKNGPDAWYGAVVGITKFGAKTVDAFILPLVSQWNVFEAIISGDADEETKYSVCRCQDALLYALGVYFKSVNNVELSKRLDFDKLSEIFGDRLEPLQTNVRNDYSMCFV